MSCTARSVSNDTVSGKNRVPKIAGAWIGYRDGEVVVGTRQSGKSMLFEIHRRGRSAAPARGLSSGTALCRCRPRGIVRLTEAMVRSCARTRRLAEQKSLDVFWVTT